MRKIVINNYQKILFIYILFNIVFLFVGACLVAYNKVEYKMYSLYLIAFLFINICIIATLFINKKIKINIMDIIVYGLCLSGINATLFSINSDASLFGYIGRYEGMFQLFYYYSLFFLGSCLENKTYKKGVIYSLLSLGIISSIYSIIQVYGLFPSLYIYKSGNMHAFGFFGHFNFNGTFILIILSLSIGMYLKEKNNTYLIFLCSLFYYVLLLTNTLSVFVGLVVELVFIIIYLFIKKESKKKYLILLGVFVLISTFLCITDKSKLIRDLNKFAKESSDIVVNGNFDEEYGTGRLYVWKSALKIIPKYLVNGAGIDCFFYSFDKPLTKMNNGKLSAFDKAHNEYLQLLITEGIFGLLMYLAFLTIILLSIIKTKFNNFPLILVFIGYLVQAFFNISVINVAPYFYLCSGLLYDRKVYDGK